MFGEHSREVTAAVFEVEPPNGSVIVVQDSDDDWAVIWRNDTEASDAWDGDARGQHWFRAADEDPMELHQYLKYAKAVYNLGSQIAELGGDDE